MSTPSLDAAYAHCAAVVRTRARNFYYGLRLTPEPRRSAVYSVYAWMRAADDLTDEAATPELKRAGLERFAASAERLIAGTDLAEDERCPVWTAFRETYRRFELDPADLRSLLAGLAWDLQHDAQAASSREPVLVCADRAELERYCYCVASTVGLICVRIWGLRPGADRAAAHRLAVQRGLAFQLTNILRDFGEDYDAGRVYLPRAEFRAAGLSVEEVRNWSRPEACASFINAISAWARHAYEGSAPLDDMIDPPCAPGLRAMTAIYSGLLRVIENAPARVAADRRVRLQSATKAGIALKALLNGWILRRPARQGATA